MTKKEISNVKHRAKYTQITEEKSRKVKEKMEGRREGGRGKKRREKVRKEVTKKEQ